MSTKINSDFILLSKLIGKLEDKEYYITYAKSLLMTNRPGIPIPSENEIVNEMFCYFIQTNELRIYHKNSEISLNDFENMVDERITDNDCSIENKDSIRKAIWDNEIYIKGKELKKLYANKCIVLPNSLLRECAEESA